MRDVSKLSKNSSSGICGIYSEFVNEKENPEVRADML